eukprot:TRINITY_DN5020_c0_g2_i1.p1 TRINITY_DN5020_c0_g2~~TRINITY_DN5020_c0_g2_i1.p1  ORF type:complete len:358 (+),score=133.17 TRINITY_DN5020_c0_g2_i1:66-1076(+)
MADVGHEPAALEPEEAFPVPIEEEAQHLRLLQAGTFTATGCPNCEQIFEVQIDFEEVKDNVEFERLKRKELEAQKEAYKQEITKQQEEVNSLKETLGNLCSQLAQAQVDNLRSKHESVERDEYIKQLKGHLKESESELHHLGQDFSLSLRRNKELHAAHLRNTGQVPQQTFRSATARQITGGDTLPGADVGPLGGHLSAEGQAAAVQEPVTSRPPADLTQGQRREWYRARLLEFYSVHNPSKLKEVDSLLLEFQGHEDEMLVMLARKYCAAPITETSAPRPAPQRAPFTPGFQSATLPRSPGFSAGPRTPLSSSGPDAVGFGDDRQARREVSRGAA